MKQNNTSTGGVSFVGLLQLLFIGLKLGNVITWSWWWVLSPMWIMGAIGVIVIIVAILVAVANK